jgi:hypothetical protein
MAKLKYAGRNLVKSRNQFNVQKRNVMGTFHFPLRLPYNAEIQISNWRTK